MKKTNSRRRKLRIDRVIYLTFAVTFFLYLCSSLVLKSLNISLAAETTRTNAKIVTAQAEVDSMTIQIKELTEYDKVIGVIEAESMTSTTSTVIASSGN